MPPNKQFSKKLVIPVEGWVDEELRGQAKIAGIPFTTFTRIMLTNAVRLMIQQKQTPATVPAVNGESTTPQVVELSE